VKGLLKHHTYESHSPGSVTVIMAADKLPVVSVLVAMRSVSCYTMMIIK